MFRRRVCHAAVPGFRTPSAVLTPSPCLSRSHQIRSSLLVRSVGTRSFGMRSSPIAYNSLAFGAFAGGMALVVGTSMFLQAESPSKPDWNKIREQIAALLTPHEEDYDDGNYGPLLVRLAWHAAGTYDQKTGKYGSNGATMRFKPESEHGANNGLALARKLLEPIRKAHPGLSYADLWTLAGAVAIEELGGPKISWRPGRRDAPDGSTAPPDGHLPDATKGSDHLRHIFNRMGFNDQEIVALAGAHCLGRCHRDRSGFVGPWTHAPTVFSNEYFRELVENTWSKKKWDGPEQYEDPSGELMMLPADLALIKDPAFRKYVEAYAKDEQLFFRDFAAAFSKLLELGVPFA